MFIAFTRTTGTTGTAVLMDASWDELKIAMCEKWEVGYAFDEHGLWAQLVRGVAVLYGNDLFHLVDTDRVTNGHLPHLFPHPWYECVLAEAP